ncbi:hypothetical protein CCYN49044_440009 [Capnocytophaga cynodegmi]|uniref:Uncharacterized protein n=1 Tax=Capnocytophaga cynodegmi TaxID=28189 RepID=A0A0B7HUA1_9FLAO|nr:hypothetical protein CCYN74_440009 [Capnocytophaga cynodegmi]CEN41083.1 hypothetical protein CCYN49044_440009 [Capnocytophaga cynodegmi]
MKEVFEKFLVIYEEVLVFMKLVVCYIQYIYGWKKEINFGYSVIN